MPTACPNRQLNPGPRKRVIAELDVDLGRWLAIIAAELGVTQRAIIETALKDARSRGDAAMAHALGRDLAAFNASAD